VNTVESLPLIGEEVRRETRWTLPPGNWITPPDVKGKSVVSPVTKSLVFWGFPAGSGASASSVRRGVSGTKLGWALATSALGGLKCNG
jgi:hypothetical protein